MRTLHGTGLLVKTKPPTCHCAPVHVCFEYLKLLPSLPAAHYSLLAEELVHLRFDTPCSPVVITLLPLCGGEKELNGQIGLSICILI